MTKLHWKHLLPLALLAPHLIAGIPTFDEDSSVQVQDRELHERVPVCAQAGSCLETRGDDDDKKPNDDAKDHVPKRKKDDGFEDDDKDAEEYEDKEEPGEDPASDNPEDYGDYDASKDKRDLVARAKNYLRLIPGLSGKLPRAAWMADKDRVAITIKRKNQEKDKNKPKKYKWEMVKKVGGHFVSTQVDHVLEIQRVEHIYDTKDVPHGAGKQAAWDIMRKAVSLDTDNNDKYKKLVAHVLNDVANLRGLHSKVNKLKGKITMMTHKGTAGPDYKKKWARSTIWGAAKYLKGTKAQYEETSKSLADLVKDITKDKDQAEWVEKQLKDLLKKDLDHITEKAKEKPGKNGEKVLKEDMGDKVPDI